MAGLAGRAVTGELAIALLARCGRPTRSDQQLEEKLAAMITAGEDAWPDLGLARREFVDFVADRVPAGAEDLAAVIAELRAADLYLACGCAVGSAAALAAFDRSYRAMTLTLARRVRSAALAPEDALQRIWQKLLVAEPDRPPGISRYGGRGALKNWLRATVLRALIDIDREGRQQLDREINLDDDALWELPATGGDPELGYLKQKYLGEFKQAFGHAIAELSPRERNLLRQQFVHGLTIDQLGAIHRIHRATAARQLAAARDALLSATRRNLRRRLEVGNAEIESIMRLIESRLEVSLRRLLGTAATPPPGGRGNRESE